MNTPIVLPAGIKLLPAKGNLPALDVQTEQAAALIYLHGAHLAHWQPAGHQPVLWMSEKSNYQNGKPIRGGVPICFPWFGLFPENSQAPMHGPARLRQWTIRSASVERSGVATIVLQLLHDDQFLTLWSHRFEVLFRVVIGQSLSMSLIVRNLDTTPFTFEEALHTYLSVGDVRQVLVRGLEKTDYVSKVEGGHRKTQADKPIRIAGETDRVYLNTQATVHLDDPSLGRRISIAKSGSQAAVVWNPWINKAKAMPDFGDDEWTGMICIETVNALDHKVQLDPEHTHTMSATLSLSKL